MTVNDILESMPYGPAPEEAKFAQDWIDAHQATFGLYYSGEWRSAKSHFDIFNPATGQKIGRVGQADAADVEAAVSAAEEAFKSWSQLSCSERGRFLYAIARQIQKHARLFSVLETIDNGKPIRETRDIDIPLVARHFYHHAGWATLRDEELIGYEPVGVCGQIIPWNFPLLMMAWKIAPALAMGNTVVLKPAEFTSLSALLFAEICQQVGLPKGVVNILTGDGETGKLIVNNPTIAKIAFTGSTEVGRHIRKATAGSGKKLSLELGGKSPFIVFEDADLDSVVEGIVDAIWFNQGQVCCAGSRLLVQEGVAEKLYAKIRARMDNLRVGDPLDKAVDIGAIVDKVQLDQITKLVAQGVSEGAVCHQPKCTFPEGGWFYPPTLLTEVEPSSTVAQVEIFGPVLVAMTFRTPAEAVALANNTVYGLASSLWTQNLDIAHDIAAQIKAGTVWINCTNQFDAAAGFGGYRESGFGREGGQEGLFEYLKPKKSKPVNFDWKAIPATERKIDQTHKLYIGGKQARPDGGYSLTLNLSDASTAEVARGNRKDIRNAVEAADSAACGWANQTGHARAQILYYLAENLEGAKENLLSAIGAIQNPFGDPAKEFDLAVERVLYWAAWADKLDGQVHQVPMRGLIYTRNEPLGPVGVIASDEAPLLGFLSSCLPLIAFGNTVVAIPSELNPLAACELIRVIEASDVPGGVWNLVTGLRGEIVKPLAEHDGLQGIWSFVENAEQIESMSAGNLKQTWCPGLMNWTEVHPEFRRRAVQVKNIWTPYGA